MLRIKNTTVVTFALLSALIAGPANQVLAIDIAIPVSASDPLISGAVNQVVGHADVLAIKNNMRNQVIDTQSQMDPKPMESVLQPLMQTSMMTQIKDQVMPQVMASLSDRNNPDGMVALFAPPVFTQ